VALVVWCAVCFALMSDRTGAGLVGVVRPRRSYPARITFSAKQAAAFAELLRGTLQTTDEMEARAVYGSPPKGLGGPAKRYVADWESGVGLPPRMLEQRIRNAGFGHLLPGASDGNFGRMIRGQRSWPRELLQIALEQVDSTLEDFLALAEGPYYANELIRKVRAIVDAPRVDSAAVDAELDELFRRLCEQVADVDAQLLRDESIAIGALRCATSFFARWQRHWLAAVAAELKERIGDPSSMGPAASVAPGQQRPSATPATRRGVKAIPARAAHRGARPTPRVGSLLPTRHGE
jgi:hypothetical protein